MRVLPLILLLGVVLAGCGTTERKGGVGDTLEARTVSAKLIEVDPRVPGDPKDITGLSRPAPGTHFLGVDVGLCNEQDAAVIPYHFQLALDDGQMLRPRYPQHVYGESKSFDGTRKGCERGWILYEVPRGAKAKALDYRYDGTDGSTPTSNNPDTSEHDHFVWAL